MSLGESETAHVRVSELLAELAHAPDRSDILLGDLVDRFGRRAFGVVVVLASLPAFLPLPAGAGAVSGPLVMLLGAQLLVGKHHPWLPGRLRAYTITQERLEQVHRRVGRTLQRLERLCRPRWPLIARSLPGVLSIGLMLVLLGGLLSLPIPLTNYPLALLIVLVGIALSEEDGLLLGAGWLATAMSCVLLAEVVTQLINQAKSL